MNHHSMRNWRWWIAEPRNFLLGLVLICLAAFLLYLLVEDVILPLVPPLISIVILIGVIMLAFGWRPGRHNDGR